LLDTVVKKIGSPFSNYYQIKCKKTKKLFALKCYSVVSKKKPEKKVQQLSWNLFSDFPGLVKYVEVYKLDEKTCYVTNLLDQETLDYHINICTKSNFLFKFAVCIFFFFLFDW
jgi:hypothetical protein